jgi:hypothetical protein
MSRDELAAHLFVSSTSDMADIQVAAWSYKHADAFLAYKEIEHSTCEEDVFYRNLLKNKNIAVNVHQTQGAARFYSDYFRVYVSDGCVFNASDGSIIQSVVDLVFDTPEDISNHFIELGLVKIS